ncbi:TauD/TfdA dioxygenase family protein [Pseudothauera rhizosphaerae]|uniref:Taurine catabolism dioxygenase n=1 Tax=Pseudothauera rhizosphaerae TaxID=2565932 RepID=A0A4V3WC06_9RHOO|nr:TauD/TfdA family dioxygenase [Pseudothauera rhizosphaerae]THF65302.1 taurine catabolism dioxygenase [Pseudothauera rhizosphaerae]
MSVRENPVPGYKLLDLEPYTPNIGAVIHGLDLSLGADTALADELRRALAEFQVLFLRRQTLTPERHVQVARIFGDPDKAKAFFPRHETQNLIELIESKPGGHRYGTDAWHADITFQANPPTAVVLYSRVIPAVGGDTVWSSATRVYDSLPAELRSYLETLEGVHSFEHSGWPRFFLSQPDGEALYRKARAEHLPVVHPVVRTHPVTGRKLVYVNPNFTSHIKGLPRQESDQLLNLLFARFTRPDFHARLRWEKDTVAIWDNRATVHYAVADYAPQHRLLHRVTVGEERAF